MIERTEFKQTALGQGILFIGIGKHGSKDLPHSLVSDILQELLGKRANIFQKGAFFGALRTKGVSNHEFELEEFTGLGILNNPEALYDRICVDSPIEMREIGVKLLSGNTLSEAEAEKLGIYLFSNLPGETFRGMAASILRIRYETEEEYWGLIKAAEATYQESFSTPVSAGKKIVQLAEPFDGVEHSYMITPLLAEALQKDGYTAITSVGRSGGPKLTLNALDVYQELQGAFLNGNADLLQAAPAYGWVLHQKDLSPSIDAWVDRRHQMIKRPFLATMEKVLNPCGAQILITSVFHITYMEKMVELAEMTGFTGVIVLKRGLEGSLAPSIARASGILCAVKDSSGNWVYQSFDADTDEFASLRASEDENVEKLDVIDNVQLIREFTQMGRTGHVDFDKRVHLGIALYRKGLQWIEEHR